ncbi:MAG: cobyrinate a,c-diamide synthase [Desulfobacteraceae bacterium]|nr:MAG: cobyrinate a,c-diamide synthase [Desulfobacteraceae bacterium]
MNCPRIIIAGLRGGSGKTIVSLGLTRMWVRSGKAVKPFKKGPDYIDAKWLSLAAGAAATNLDPFLLRKPVLRSLFWTSVGGYDGALIEGNRGIFDGKDLAGSYSTAELARIVDAPLLLVMDCTKMTRTAAAVVRGIIDFEPDVRIAGVILNRTANDRHRAIVRDAVEHYTGIPVIGALPRLKKNPLPERHMGLISDQEYALSAAALDEVADLVQKHVDVSRIWQIACSAAPLKEDPAPGADAVPLRNVWTVTARALPPDKPPVRIGYVRDAALWFYYEENLEALRRAGAQLVPLSLLEQQSWPEMDGLYLGGGFPETMAEQLACNQRVRRHVKAEAERGLPIYAECGGLMYLGRSLIYKDNRFPMADVLPLTTELCERPQGLGYIEATVTAENPYHPLGAIIRGHEFHYSKCIVHDDAPPLYCLKINKGYDAMGSDRDGLLAGNVFASYLHLFALGEPHWAFRFVQAADRFRSARRSPVA